MQFGAAGVRALADAGPPDVEGRVEAEVLGPAGLRQAVAAAVAVLADRYATGPSSR